jgi:hypothetical protein
MNLKLWGLIASLIGGAVFAQNYDQVVKKSAGTYVQTYVYSVVATGDTLISGTAATKMVDLTCRNTDTTYDIFIGSDSVGAGLISIGFPIKALETFEIGAMSGQVYAIADTGQTIEVRCWEGKIQ